MTGAPTNLNSIHIPLVQSTLSFAYFYLIFIQRGLFLGGCLQVEYDSTYPIHLSGIISQQEFQESINKINSIFPSLKTWKIICWIMFAATITSGTICCTIGGIMAVKSMTVFYVLLGIGVTFTSFGSIGFSIGFCIIHSKGTARIRQAISKESMKYSTRSPIPCSWRLDTLRTLTIGYTNYNNYHMNYHVSTVFYCLHLFKENQRYFKLSSNK